MLDYESSLPGSSLAFLLTDAISLTDVFCDGIILYIQLWEDVRTFILVEHIKSPEVTRVPPGLCKILGYVRYVSGRRGGGNSPKHTRRPYIYTHGSKSVPLCAVPWKFWYSARTMRGKSHTME